MSRVCGTVVEAGRRPHIRQRTNLSTAFLVFSHGTRIAWSQFIGDTRLGQDAAI